MKKEDIRIVFMGTPDFAVASLRAIYQAGYNIVGVVTAPDRPAGRGQKIQFSAVKKYAVENGLNLLQPANLKEENFLNDLKWLQANLQVVVAFRMLPKAVWDMPELGTFNLHASLLPQYRGAAPINHAIINGEKTTGLTTFFLDEKIDTGQVILQSEIEIGEEETAGELHDKMMLAGASLVLKTIEQIRNGSFSTVNQYNLSDELQLKPAPKIFKEDCEINWGESMNQIYNLIRGLSPYPAAYSTLITPDGNFNMKIFNAKPEKFDHHKQAGSIDTDGKNYLKVFVRDGLLCLTDVQLEGKKRMMITDFLNGFKFSQGSRFANLAR